MPIVEITMVEGRSAEQKQALFRSVTTAIVASLEAPPENVRIILREVPPAHFAVAGEAKFGRVLAVVDD